MKFKNVYFINGTAYAGKSTMVKLLAEKHGGIACEENYHNAWLNRLDPKEFPGLCYTRDLQDWRHFIRRTPDEYEAWIRETSKECAAIELQMLEEIAAQGKPVFADTNISPEVLHQISDREHVLIMLADPQISVNRFFERPDREKQFLYRLLMEEENPSAAMANFRECLSRINSEEAYEGFMNCGFKVITRDDRRSIEETLVLAEHALGLPPDKAVLDGAIAQIQRMEALFDSLLISPDKEKLQVLTEYYEGGKWMYHYRLDELGLLPADLKRGVLSEDGVYNLLTQADI